MKSEDLRRGKLRTLLQSIKNCGEKGAVKEKIIAVMGVEFGTSRRKALEYISCLRFAEEVIEKEGMLYAKQTLQEGEKEGVEDMQGVEGE